jgi:hypothetical protein
VESQFAASRKYLLAGDMFSGSFKEAGPCSSTLHLLVEHLDARQEKGKGGKGIPTGCPALQARGVLS